MASKTDRDVSNFSDIRSIEKLWAKELYELNPNKREKINDELHGVSFSQKQHNLEEGWSEQHYSFYLDSFQTEIDKVLPQDKQSYLEGVELGSSYILSPDFRLAFLRVERYDIEAAAIRYCFCLDFLVEFFGKDALFRPLILTDLTKREMKFLREGFVQVLPSRDRLGRRIMINLGDNGGTRYTSMEKNRVNFYLCFTVLATDVTSQRLGTVSIISFTRGAEESMRKEGRAISKLLMRFWAAVPVRWSASHLCLPDDGPMYHLIKAVVVFCAGPNGRLILRIHTGTPMECDYKLRSFGIPTDDIPRTHTHTIKLKNHTRLIKARKVIDTFMEQSMVTNEAKNVRFPGIECPEINCVIFGKYAWDQPGNIEFRGLLREMRIAEMDRDLEMHSKMRLLIEELIQASVSRKFRFLIYDRETFFYKEVTEYVEIWDLVDQSVREHRKRSKAKRMIDETKFAIGKNIDKHMDVDDDVSNISAISMGNHRMNGAKFMKDCNGCRCFVGD